jgi:glyoxylase-like metal-dependent hydrolase (beta-lactamase superfamily II)
LPEDDVELLTRREVVIGAGVATACLGLGRSVVLHAEARSRSGGDPNPGFFRYRIGDAECIALFDGLWEKKHDPHFFRNASISQTKRALSAAGLRSDFVAIPVTALLIRMGGRLVLCDAGGGGRLQVYTRSFPSGRLKANLAAAGIDARDIGAVLISHFHPDHVFGLLGPGGEPAFPNAEIIVPAAEYRSWTDDRAPKTMHPTLRRLERRIRALIPRWRNVLPVEGEDEVVPGIRFVATPGHTAGHTSFLLSSGSAQHMIAGDAIYMPALAAPHPEWQGTYDEDGPLAVASRRKLMDRVIADGMTICGCHFPWPGVGRIARDGSSYAFTMGA